MTSSRSSATSGPSRLLRVALLAAMGLGMMVSASSAQEAAVAMSVESITPRELALGPFSSVLTLSRAQQEALKAQERATLSAIESMATPRALVLGFLAASTLVVFIAALQLRLTLDAPSLVLARRLGLAALASAVLRTMDGAQQLVIVRRAAEASGRALLGAGGADTEAAIAMTQTLVSIVSVGWTAFVVALFVVLGSYLRSPKVLSTFVESTEDHR